MCILCVIQKWSRRVVTMLPWIVIPLIALWALSQLFPPGFRFEITSPRAACVLVLLVTLFWYEILMPYLSIWRARRNASIREKKRSEAVEFQKLKKMATRLCRNCLTPYREQNPGGGRFMCSYCGHVSKRPVLDIPGLSERENASSEIFGSLFRMMRKILDWKVWSERSCISGQDCFGNENWDHGSNVGKSTYQGKNKDRIFNSKDSCSNDESYSSFILFAYKLLNPFFLIVSRYCSRFGFSMGDFSLSGEHNGLSKKDNDGVNLHESRVEKARRKAEEKRQARLERELLEEEERKQREEVARLVEEQRRLRDEKMNAEKERGKITVPERKKDSKRESERKRQEKRKEKDKGSSKSNSDVEDLDRRAGKEIEKRQEREKRNEIERRDFSKILTESFKVNRSEMGDGLKVSTTNNFSSVSGTKYLEQMKGSILSSSKAFKGSGFFGNAAHSSANVVLKANKPNCSVGYAQLSANCRELSFSGHLPGKINSNGGDKLTENCLHKPVASDLQPQRTPKKTWQQLFTRTSSVAPIAPDAKAVSSSNQMLQAVAQSPPLMGQASPTHPLDNQTYSGPSLPFTLSPFPNESCSFFSLPAEPNIRSTGKSTPESKSEEPEIFEDPCYDPMSLLGPVSDSLDNFPSDLGSGFVTDVGRENFHTPPNASVSAEVNRPSPIESPMSRLRIVEERRTNSTPKTQDLKTSSPNDSNNAQEQGTWTMWSTPSIGHDALGLVGGSAGWLLPLGQNTSNQESYAHPSQQNPMLSQLAMEHQVLLGTHSPQKTHFSDCQNAGIFSPAGPGSRKEMSCDSPSISANSHQYELSPANCWSKMDLPVHGSEGGVGKSTLARPPIGGLFSSPDVQSLWSFT